MSLILDDVGALGYPVVPATPLRVVGVVIAFTGAVMVQVGDAILKMWNTRKEKRQAQNVTSAGVRASQAERVSSD